MIINNKTIIGDVLFILGNFFNAFLKFTGNIRAMQEGELCFGNEPLLRVEAPLIQAQLIETILLNIVNFHTLITTKASRIRNKFNSGYCQLLSCQHFWA